MSPRGHLLLFASLLLTLSVTQTAAFIDRLTGLLGNDDGDVGETTPFTCRDCGGTNAAMRVNRVFVSPNPIVLPGVLRVELNVDILRNITGTMKADIQVSRKMDFGWLGSFWLAVTLPCDEDSCRTDLCAEFERIVATGGCPPEITTNGFECTCPPSPGSYVTMADVPLVATVKDRDLPPDILRDLITGIYSVRTVVYDANGTRVGCYDTEFAMRHQSQD